eukprot:gb/GECH01012686.1/.p1 GENE.gb/GECH01012686.1/~~gb/GECH01012686.1/.p1  ORF type:complete len:479 (+),score=76.42 gb/GECH01012686.1/:1-1437(+)
MLKKFNLKKIILYILLFQLLFLLLPHITIAQQQKQKRYAYVGITYNNDFLLASWTMFKSLQLTGTPHDFVLLTEELPNDTWIQRFSEIGVQVRLVDPIPNPFSNAPKRFDKVMNKLHAWKLTEYERVVYLDSDVIAEKNIDHLFDCGNFCAVMRHSDKFNTGVFVLKPSYDRFNHMWQKSKELTSYEGADQGFLNAYFSDVITSPFFGPETEPQSEDTDNRLSTVYNVDIGMFYFGGKWQIPREQHHILHFTFGTFKPWHWYWHPVFTMNHKWSEVAIHFAMLTKDKITVILMSIVSAISLLLSVSNYISKRETLLDSLIIRQLFDHAPKWCLVTCSLIVTGVGFLVSNIAAFIIPISITDIRICWLLYIMLQMGTTLPLALTLSHALLFWRSSTALQDKPNPKPPVILYSVLISGSTWIGLELILLSVYLFFTPKGQTIISRFVIMIGCSVAALIITFVKSFKFLLLHVREKTKYFV